MITAPEKFEINCDGIVFIAERYNADQHIYRLSNAHGTYMIAKDFYGSWVELTSKRDSAPIYLAQLGELIEEHEKSRSGDLAPILS